MSEAESVVEVRQRYGVPSTLSLRVDDREVLAWLGGYAMAVRDVAAHPDDLPRSARHGGRAQLRHVDGPQGSLLVREYKKGGLLRHVRGPRMRGRWRPLDELVLHRRLQAVGVPVVEAVGCVIRRHAVGWRGFLLVREIEGAVDLEAWLHGVLGPAPAGRAEVLRDAGHAVRRLHDAGVPHPDLHPKNLLLAPDGSLRVLDLDKIRPRGGRLEEGVRLENLVRLARAVEKHRLKGMRVGGHDALRFLTGYAGSREAARLWMRRIHARLRRGRIWRSLWWRLSGEARPWRGDVPAAGEA